MKTKRKPRAKPKVYPILVRCCDDGATFGVRQAFKHSDSPSVEYIIECVARETLNHLCEALEVD